MATNNVHLLIEPFNSGSHKQLIDILLKNISGTYAVTLPGKKWPWKARTSALLLSQMIPRNNSYSSLFASSVLNLAELVALRPDLARLHKVLYFHENQLVYPVRRQEKHDFQFGYNQILSCLVADVVLFNSDYNKECFLGSIKRFLKLIPYERPRDIAIQLRPKCHVLHFPVDYPRLTGSYRGGFVMDNTVNTADLLDTGESVLEEVKDETFEDNYRTTGKIVSAHSCNDVESITETSSSESADEIDRLHGSDVCEIICQKKTVKDISQVSEKQEEKAISTVKSAISTDNNRLNSDTVLDTLNSSKCTSQPRPVSMEEDEQLRTPENATGLDEVPSDRKKARHDNRVAEYHQSDKQFDPDETPHYLASHQDPNCLQREHDKGPEEFFSVMFKLQQAEVQFRLSVLGENFAEKPDVFEEAKVQLADRIVHWGYVDSKDEYYNVLQEADCVVSTAKHEFFGVAMLEAVHLGCYPLCPNRLVYPEIFSKEYLYNTDNQLLKKLREFCRKPHLVRNHRCKVDTRKYSWDSLNESYLQYITAKDNNCGEQKGDNS